jgi:hypothetical protein
MALDTSVLYGIMGGSALGHIGAAVLSYVFIKSFQGLTIGQKTLYFILAVAGLSFVIQTLCMSSIQSYSCNGVSNYKSLFVAGFVGAVITLLMIAIPIYFEPMRLIVSQLFGPHMTLMTPERAAQAAIIEKAAKELGSLGAKSGDGLNETVDTTSSEETTSVPTFQKGGALSIIEYNAQQFKELMMGAAYWAAFAGAYGVGIGSTITGKCKSN